MNQNFLWILILLNLFLVSALGADFHYEACSVPKTCSNYHQEIKFPFYIQEKQENFCGFPGFNLSCNRNDHPIIRLSDDDYVIHQIFYDNHSLRVSNAAFDYTNTNTCVPLIHNLSLPTSNPFQPISSTNIFLLYNCNSSSIGRNLTDYKRDCPGSNLSEALFEENPDLGYALDQCRNGIVTKAPAEMNGMKSDGPVVETLRTGFGLSWTANNCSVCERSRGICGFDYEVYQFRCFCTDRPHARQCNIPDGKNKKMKVGIIVCSVALGFLIVALIVYIRKYKLRKRGEKDLMDLPIFGLAAIAQATDNFSVNNKLGQGGFGPVYKGTWMDGQEIAVKKLSKSSGQGLTEFMNEVKLISKLQHRNLVRILGCCVEGEEKMLVYEYMPNKSLDFFIFDLRTLLDWHKRLHIIDGIARGILYLHQDSRLRIIHRDLKASNVLLDKDMNPKISDFGMARMVGVDETEANTNRVVGTYGYKSPEYAMDGLFSVKSDVFSFGVLVLEIVSGMKNRGFSHPDHNHNLLGHAWRLWMEEKPLELADGTFGDSFVRSEVLRCIHVGLLCVQQRPEDRPNMSAVVLMLNGATPLPDLKKPGFFTERNMPEAETSTNKSFSKNELSITTLEPR